MPRTARVKSSSQIYHVIIRSVNRQIIFEEQRDNQKFLHILQRSTEKFKVKYFAYCLMSNHVHLLMKSDALPDVMRFIECSFVYWYNTKYERSGHLFQDRYRCEPVEDEKYFMTVLRYIHFNPVKARMVKRPGNYTWSSHDAYVKNAKSFVDTSFAIKMYGDRKALIEFLKVESDDKCLEITNTRKQLTVEKGLKIMKEQYNLNGPSDFQQLTRMTRNKYLKELKGMGLSIRQLVMLTGFSKGTIEKV